MSQKTPACVANRTPEQLAAIFRDYFNNFLTVSAFADHYGISAYDARVLIEAGRIAHEGGF
jgi:hypothetical protein